MSDNTTRCFASQQTIARKDLCMVIPLMQQASFTEIELSDGEKTHKAWGMRNCSVGLDSLWKPMCSFLPAVFDDFGIATLKISTNLDRTRAMSFFGDLFSSAMVAAAGKNQYHEPEIDVKGFMESSCPKMFAALAGRQMAFIPVIVTSDEFDTEMTAAWDYVSKAIRHDRLFVTGNNGKPRQVVLGILHQSAADALRDMCEKGSDWDGNSMALKKRIRTALQKAGAARDAALANPGTEENDHSHWLNFEREVKSSASIYTGGESIEHIDARAGDHVIRRFAKGEMDLDTAVDNIALAYRDLPTLYGLKMLQLQFQPMAHLCADPTNRLGNAIAEFATKLAPGVQRQRIVAKFGPIRRFKLQSKRKNALQTIQRILNDGDREPVMQLASPVGAPADQLMFECPISLRTLALILKECGAANLAKGLQAG